MNLAPNRRWSFSPRTLFIVVAAFLAGLVASFFGVGIQEHHGWPWASVLVSAPVIVLARLISDQGEFYSWPKVVGSAFLYALYAYLLIENKTKGRWLYVLGFHGTCAIILVLMSFER